MKVFITETAWATCLRVDRFVTALGDELVTDDNSERCSRIRSVPSEGLQSAAEAPFKLM